MRNRDSFVFGLIIGLLIPAIGFVIFYLMDMLAQSFFSRDQICKTTTMQLVSFALNLLAIRYYFVNLKFEKTGRGVLFVTFIYLFLFFFFSHGW
ncbi:MAG: hypothetical protein KAT48_09125 [Bacteroidales bacterium]|nr:hypothetical protein [Bacteroidales bacterium]